MNPTTKNLTLFLCLILGSAAACSKEQKPPAPPSVDLSTTVVTSNTAAFHQHIAAGSDLNAKELGGNTPLNLTAIYGRPEMARALLNAGANLEIANNEKTTPLFNAAFFSHPDIVKMLLEKGANPAVTDKNGIPILAIVASPWSPELAGIYNMIGGMLQIPMDLERIKTTRPEIVALLEKATPARAEPASPDSTPIKKTTMHRVAPVAPGDWPTYNQNVLGWRFNEHEKTLSPTNASQLKLQWRFPPAGSAEKVGVIHATPSVVDGYIFFGTATYGAFYCLSPNGELVWKYHVGDEARRSYREAATSRGLTPQDGVYTSALVTDDGVYFSDTAGVMYGLDRETGREKWQVNSKAGPFPGAHPANLVMGSPILADGKFVFGGGGYEHPQPLDPNYKCCSGRGFVVALHPETGTVQWKYDVGPTPQPYDPPLVMEDEYGKHLFHFGPSTSSVWSTPSWDKESNTVFFGTDTHNAPRKPTADDPRNYTIHSSAVIAVSGVNGREQWVSQIAPGDVWNHSMPAWDSKSKRYKDLSIGDTPKLYTINRDGQSLPVVGAGCKNGGFYVLERATGKILVHTPVYTGPPISRPRTDPRTLALPGPIGGLQTGCATDGQRVYVNGIDRLPNAPLEYMSPNPPTGGRVTSISLDTRQEFWRHERPKIPWIGGTTDQPLFNDTGDPIASGIALANGLAFCTTFSSNRLLCLNSQTGELLKEFPLGPVLCGPSISRGRVYVGTGNTQFSNTQEEAYFPKKFTGELLVFGLEPSTHSPEKL